MNMIVAVNHNGIIGKDNDLLWYIPEDLKHFRKLTLHNIVVMGRKTYESLPNGPLKNRINIVITSHPEKYKDTRSNLYFSTCADVGKLIQYIQSGTNKEVFIIGGSQIYAQFYKECNTIFVTLVHTDETNGISIQPIICEIEKTYKKDKVPETPGSSGGYTYEFIIYRRTI
jgi:dihydrofolate reductase